MVSIKIALVREVLALQDYTYYHYTHRKIPVLMVLIIEACEAIRLLHKRLKRKNPSVFYPFPCFRLHLGTKTAITLQPFIARFFSKMHRAHHVILVHI